MREKCGKPIGIEEGRAGGKGKRRDAVGVDALHRRPRRAEPGIFRTGLNIVVR